MYVNIKMISVQTAPGIREGGMKERSGGGEFEYDTCDTFWEPL
jgi:hypothetical protein